MVTGMSEKTDSGELHRYVETTSWIRELSAPQLTGVKSAEDYRVNLLHNFTRIGELARANSRILNVSYYPLIKSEDPLTEGDIQAIRMFSGMLFEAYTQDYMDLPMLYVQSARLLHDADRKQDVRHAVDSLNDMVRASCAMMYMTERLAPAYGICYQYRDVGMSAARRLTEYLAPEKFVTLPGTDSRHKVLMNARFVSALFNRRDTPGDYNANESDLAMLRRALALADDPFYLREASDFSWDYHVYRTLHNFAMLTERNNANGYDKKQLAEINRYTLMLYEKWKEHPEAFEGVCTEETIELYLARNGYLAGSMHKEAYKDALREIIDRRNERDFSAAGIVINLLAPLEWVLVTSDETLSAEEEEFLAAYYEHLVGYVYHIPKKGSFSFMLTFLTDHLMHYRTVAQGLSFETICLRLMAALHPPTYVHSLSTADIAVCLATHLIEKKPELFQGVLGTEDVQSVRRKQKDIIEYVRHAALMHDVGKLFIMETILTYGRQLFSHEYELINAHPQIGAQVLAMHADTVDYAEVALGHHRDYDNGGGYPLSFDTRKAAAPAVVALIACADCLDASTDMVGRSYKDGKTLARFKEELDAGSGTKYAPYIAALFEDEAVCTDVEALIAIGRDDNYRETYRILETL